MKEIFLKQNCGLGLWEHIPDAWLGQHSALWLQRQSFLVFQTSHFTRQKQGQQEDTVLHTKRRITATPPNGFSREEKVPLIL